MNASLDTLKIFISYSWAPAANKEATRELAERLMRDGVHVVLDIWDLVEGQDKYVFMEQMVKDPGIKRVLLICNKDYAEKANNRKGGVGTEALIVSKEIYAQADQKKFVPVIVERDGEGKEYLPTFVHSRIYIDLSSPDNYEDQYEKLIRNIFDRPAEKRPALGTPPAYLKEEEPLFVPTAHKVETIKNALVNEKKNSQVFIDDYYEAFVEGLKQFEIDEAVGAGSTPMDELVLQKIEALRPLRDDFIRFLEVVFTFSVDFNQDRFHTFIERLAFHVVALESTGIPRDRNGYLRYDQYRFFYYELILYTMAVMLEKERYKELAALLYSSYLVIDSERKTVQPHSIVVFQNYVRSLDEFRNKRLLLRQISITANTIKERAVNSKYPFFKLIECDVLLYYISVMENMTQLWWPLTSAYRINGFLYLTRLVSKRNFEKFKPVFNVSSLAELKAKVQTAIDAQADKLPRHDFRPPYLKNAFDFNSIATIA